MEQSLNFSTERASTNKMESASLKDLIDTAIALIADQKEQLDADNKTIEEGVRNKRQEEARGFFELALLKRYKKVDVPEFIKNMDAIGNVDVAEGLANVYGLDITKLRTPKRNAELLQ